MKPTRFHNLTTPALVQELETLTNVTAASIKSAATILQELKTRGETHPLMREGAFRFYQEIAANKLSAKAVLAFAGVNSILRNLIGLPMEKQDAFAKGAKLTIATHDTTGKIKSVEKPLIQLSVRQLDLAFDGAGGVRAFNEQAQIISARTANRPSSRRSILPVAIRADQKTGELVCGQLRFTPHQLTAAMQKLGFKIVRVAA